MKTSTESKINNEKRNKRQMDGRQMVYFLFQVSDDMYVPSSCLKARTSLVPLLTAAAV